MRTLLLPAIVAIFLVPFHSADAQAETYGGFKPKYKFSFKVEEVVSVEHGIDFVDTSLKRAVPNIPIPKGLPKYKKGQTVRFKIGQKGELIAVGTKIPFTEDGGTSNLYSKETKGTHPKSDNATVYKDSNNEATSVALTFTRSKGSGVDNKIYLLTYTLR